MSESSGTFDRDQPDCTGLGAGGGGPPGEPNGGVRVKICGLTDEASVQACNQNGVDFAGFVFYPKSSRYLAPEDAAALASGLSSAIRAVALVVDPGDPELDAIFGVGSFDWIQLHGSETEVRLREIRSRWRRPVIRSIPVADSLHGILPADSQADAFLLDAPRPHPHASPGGNGIPFDWKLARRISTSVPLILSGGLNPGTVREAISGSGISWLDVSSGVEVRPGVKSPALITEFVRNARMSADTRRSADRSENSVQ